MLSSLVRLLASDQNLKYEIIEVFCLTSMCVDDIQDPFVHPWGGLTTTRDGTLTLLDCYLYSKSLKGLQNVCQSYNYIFVALFFLYVECKRAECELLYTDACGGGGRGWISQGMMGHGRGHLTRGTCALHIARRSLDTLVDFWSELGEETRHSLLKMEENFMEHQMYRYVLTIDFVSNLNNLIKYCKHIPSLTEKNISMFFQSCVLLPYGLLET
ncbi:hypothetical protein Hdeb2414_s0052g00753001 [Helianthus debilis subsp. tardiflorus]